MSVVRTVAALVILLVSVPAGAAEFRPVVSGGYADVVDAHGAIGAHARLQFWRYAYVQPEYVWLVAPEHTDSGPALQVGISGASRSGLRLFAGIGAGPVKGLAGDDGLVYLAVGTTYPISRHVFIEGEGRYGLLGESGYGQIALGVGITR